MHLLDMAFKLARINANCKEAHVGCLITTHHHHILGTGTTGMIAPHGHDRHDCCCMGYCRSSHAEARAVAACGSHINRARILFTTHAPCPDCINLLLATPVEEIVFSIDNPISPSCMLWERGGRTWTWHSYNPHKADNNDSTDYS